VASFLLGEIYHLNPVWFFLLWNSIGLFLILRKAFRGHFKKLSSPHSFSCGWLPTGLLLCFHAWVRMIYWVPLMGLELFIGFLAANLLFGIRPPPEAVMTSCPWWWRGGWPG